MGVSLEWRPAKGGKWRYINVGWRSMLYNLLFDAGMLGDLDAGDIEPLQEIATQQRKGIGDPPFDWSQDIHDEIGKIIAAIQKYGNVSVRALW